MVLASTGLPHLADNVAAACPRGGRAIEAGEVTWPVHAGGMIVDGGCQDCWDAEADASWWAEVRRVQLFFGTDADK